MGVETENISKAIQEICKDMRIKDVQECMYLDMTYASCDAITHGVWKITSCVERTCGILCTENPYFVRVIVDIYKSLYPDCSIDNRCVQQNEAQPIPGLLFLEEYTQELSNGTSTPTIRTPNNDSNRSEYVLRWTVSSLTTISIVVMTMLFALFIIKTTASRKYRADISLPVESSTTSVAYYLQSNIFK